MFDSESVIRYGGLLILFLSVFCQTGLFFCFFIPSGGLLFTAGVFVATGDLHENLFVVCSLLIISSVLGNILGYWLGWKAGPMMYKRRDSRFFKRRHLAKAEAFYKKYGNIALAGGLFFPVIRTFSPTYGRGDKTGFPPFRAFHIHWFCALDFNFCNSWLFGRYHAIFEAVFEIYCHRHYPWRNSSNINWNCQEP